eukprot:s3307_g1.t1
MCCTLQSEKSICTLSSLQGTNVKFALSSGQSQKLQVDTWQTHNVGNVLPWRMADHGSFQYSSNAMQHSQKSELGHACARCPQFVTSCFCRFVMVLGYSWPRRV